MSLPSSNPLFSEQAEAGNQRSRSGAFALFESGFSGATAVSTALLLLCAWGVRADYQGVVLGDRPVAYYRLNGSTQGSPINTNSGTLGAAGTATNDLQSLHSFAGALAGDGNRSAFFDSSSRTQTPWNPAFNPANTQPFTVEAWLYPASDQTDPLQCPMDNRYAWSGGNWQGWSLFQGRSDTNHPGAQKVGWDFRMYDENGDSPGLEVASLLPYELGRWTHLAVVYAPAQLTNAVLTIYINGVAANTNAWSGSTPGYVANTNGHTNAAAALALGNCNNTAGTNLNPYFGAVDEFAFYTNQLTPAQVLAHYQNGTNSDRSVHYAALIQSANPVVYLRLDELPPGPDTALNLGDVRCAGLATHTGEVRHPVAGALAGRGDESAVAYHNRNGTSVTTIPWLAENNPDSDVPFTLELWLRPLRDLQGGQTPLNNRFVHSGNRTGWVIYQRNPNSSYPPSEGLGWNFRMYTGLGTGGQNVYTDTDYRLGEWGHLVVTWEPQVDYGDYYGNGNHEVQGVLTAYWNGQPAGTNESVLYAANRNPTEDASAPADFALGAYNAASGLGQNPFEGDIDEVAFYNNYLVTPEQVLAHYQAGTNANFGTNYETLVLTAPFSGQERQGPKTYLRFNDPAPYAVANTASAGLLDDGSLVLTTNTAAGPQPPEFPGFESSNPAVPLDGVKQWAGLNNPSNLNFAGQITLEAWINPAAAQSGLARIVSHGPPLLSDFLSVAPDAAVTNGAEVFLLIDAAAGQYAVGSSQFTNGVGTNTYAARFALPPGELGGNAWVHLAGTYDGTAWRLYRNGAQVALAAAPFGALAIPNADWAIGAAGEGWTDSFAGLIDEVGIYNYALPAARIATHYQAALSPPRITLSRSGSSVVLTWPYGALYESDDPTGPWTPVQGNPASPYTVTAGAQKKFYRF